MQALTNLKDELATLIQDGADILHGSVPKGGENAKLTIPRVASRYQGWYTRAAAVVRQVLPERQAEFEECYRTTKRKEIDILTYGISDYLMGITLSRGGEELFDARLVFVDRFVRQQHILAAAQATLGDSLRDIRGTLQAELFDDELAVADELRRKKHLRAAGAVAGVVLERHLQEIAGIHRIRVTKRHPTIADLNDPLKAAGIYDVPRWRQIQRAGDIRNLCVHQKEREPTVAEVEELVSVVGQIVKTVF